MGGVEDPDCVALEFAFGRRGRLVTYIRDYTLNENKFTGLAKTIAEYRSWSKLKSRFVEQRLPLNFYRLFKKAMKMHSLLYNTVYEIEKRNTIRNQQIENVASNSNQNDGSLRAMCTNDI